MTTTKWTAALLGATALTLIAVSAATAQDAAAPAAVEAAPTAEEAAAQIEFLRAQVDAMQAQLDALKKVTAAATPAWSGGPTFKDSGFSFKPSGEIQYDAGFLSNPENRLVNVGQTNRYGFNNRARRLLIGAAGDLPGDFKYSFQFNFAQSVVDFEDVVLSWEPKGKPYTVTIGYFYPYNTLENLTSNRFTSFVERASMTDAFAEGRRIGIGFGYVSGDLRINAGMFGGTINNANYDNNDYEGAARIVYAPQALGGQLHFAANAQVRRFKTSGLGQQYRAKPYSATTDLRFVDTGTIAGSGDRILGVEAAGIFGPVHVAGEAQFVRVDAYRPGTVAIVGQTLSGTPLASDPNFFSIYGEAGFWLTGETRGYKNGRFDRTKILNGVDKGGIGGVQIVGRVDYLDMRDQVGGNNVGTQVVNGVLNGGRQTGYLGIINWWPIDYVRFSAEYMHANVEGGPRAAVIKPLSTSAIYDRKYGVDAAVIRAQIDF